MSLSCHSKTNLFLKIALLKLSILCCWYADVFSDNTSVSGDEIAALYLLNYNAHIRVASYLTRIHILY